MRKLTAADVQKVTGYSRNQLRGLLDELPAYSGQAPSVRIAREFTPHDLIVLSVVSILESRVGLRRRAIVAISELLRKVLSGPKKVNRGARLMVSFDPPLVSYIASGLPSRDGVLISLGPIFERVDRYLGYADSASAQLQPNLRLGPTLISTERRKGAG
jgi:hypothetical protein